MPHAHGSNIDSRMDKEDVLYIHKYTHTHIHTNTHSGILLSNKKERNNDTCNNIDAPEIIILSEVNQRKTNII